jgi:hypothetical protein
MYDHVKQSGITLVKRLGVRVLPGELTKSLSLNNGPSPLVSSICSCERVQHLEKLGDNCRYSLSTECQTE